MGMGRSRYCNLLYSADEAFIAEALKRSKTTGLSGRCRVVYVPLCRFGAECAVLGFGWIVLFWVAIGIPVGPIEFSRAV
jgi:hypothetical protein